MNTVSLFKIKEIKQKMISIYQPAEDSYLLSETLKKEIPKILKKNPDNFDDFNSIVASCSYKFL